MTVPDGALAGADGLASGGPTITSQPDDATVTEGKIAYFAIAVHGVGPLTYQWHRDGSPIAGANGGVHATPAASLADSGATFSVTVTDDLGESTTSDRATLTVQPAP